VLEECLQAAQTLVISQVSTFAYHIVAILVVLVGCWWKPCQKPFRVGTVVVSPSMASGEMALFLLQNLSGRRADARRGFAMFLATHILLQQAFFSLNVSGLLPFGGNKLCIFVSALWLSSL
jgi:hypothetical protein